MHSIFNLHRSLDPIRRFTRAGRFIRWIDNLIVALLSTVDLGPRSAISLVSILLSFLFGLSFASPDNYPVRNTRPRSRSDGLLPRSIILALFHKVDAITKRERELFPCLECRDTNLIGSQSGTTSLVGDRIMLQSFKS